MSQLMIRLFFCTIFLLASSEVIAGNSTSLNLSRQLKPKFPLSYYANESDKYFDTLDTYAPRDSRPVYSSHVIRWEWYPWLYLTGYKKKSMKLDRLLVLYPTRVINRDCRGFDVQPFGRCRVTFHYEWPDSYVDIYEEFTFNDRGQITFIEAWSDEEGLLPMDPNIDPWAQGSDVSRISTKIPGLGLSSGRFNRSQLKQQAKNDPDLKKLVRKMRTPILSWIKEGVRFLIKGH